MSPLQILLAGLAFASLMMAAVWLLAVRIRNAGIVDVAWSLGFAPIALLDRVLADGTPWRQNLITGMAMLWSLRLGVHLWKRVARHHPAEDGRYVELRRAVSGRENLFFFGFFQAQAILLALLSLPFLLVNLDARPGAGLTDLLGFLIWVAAIAGETVADRQLATFQKDPSNHGKVCDTGLWRYSRHPNYFFEWLVWVAFFVISLPAPWGWTTILCPALMLFFLLRVTGIPYTEQQSLRSRGDAYRRYQERTSPFLPWFPKT